MCVRSAVGWLRWSRWIGISSLTHASFHSRGYGAEDPFDDESDDDEVQEHLESHESAGEFGLRGDVAESDSGEHGDGEIHGVDLAHGLGKAVDLRQPG